MLPYATRHRRACPARSGAPRTKGKRLPTLAAALADPVTTWQRVTVSGWYGEGERAVEISSATAVRRHREAIPRRDVSEADRGGMPVVPLRWVLIRDPLGKFDPQALLCTDQACDPMQVLRWFMRRWQVEVTFREVRDHLGVETQRQWSDPAIARTMPCLLGLFSLVALLAAQLAPRGTPGHSNQRLVSQAAPDLLRHAGGRAPGNVARTGFRHVPQIIGRAETPASPPRGHHLRALPRRMMAKVELNSC